MGIDFRGSIFLDSWSFAAIFGRW